jgi:hypothetical protein
MRPNRSTAVLTAASASARLVMSILTASRSFDCPKTCDRRLLSRAVATTACPADKTAFAKSTPIPRLAPVMNQILLLPITAPRVRPAIYIQFMQDSCAAQLRSQGEQLKTSREASTENRADAGVTASETASSCRPRQALQ